VVPRDGYASKVRMLRHNLSHKESGLLRRRVLDGSISPDELVNMSADALAPSSVKRVREEADARVMKRTVLSEADIPVAVNKAGQRFRVVGGSMELVGASASAESSQGDAQVQGATGQQGAEAAHVSD